MVSQTGPRVSAVAIPLVAAVMLDASPVQVGILTAAKTVPLLALGLVAGVWTDRRPRRRITIAVDLGRAVALLAGTRTVFFDAAARSFVPGPVGRRYLVDANGRLQTGYALADAAGPGSPAGSCTDPDGVGYNPGSDRPHGRTGRSGIAGCDEPVAGRQLGLDRAAPGWARA